MQKESQKEERQKNITSSSENGDEPKIILAICTLGYQKKTVDCLLSIMYDRLFEGWVIPECCLLPTTRNIAVREAYEQCPDFTHIMFLDDDMNNFASAHVQLLWKADKDIIQALVCCRKPPYTMVHFTDMPDKEVVEIINSRKNLVQPTSNTGMAFTLIKRKVFDDTREETPDGAVWFTMDRDPREGFDEEIDEFVGGQASVREAIAFGQNSHIGSVPVGEDVNFCRRAKKMGYECFTHLGVHVGHIGTNTYDWRYAVAHEYAPAEPETSIIT